MKMNKVNIVLLAALTLSSVAPLAALTHVKRQTVAAKVAWKKAMQTRDGQQQQQPQQPQQVQHSTDDEYKDDSSDGGVWDCVRGPLTIWHAFKKKNAEQAMRGFLGCLGWFAFGCGMNKVGAFNPLFSLLGLSKASDASAGSSTAKLDANLKLAAENAEKNKKPGAATPVTSKTSKAPVDPKSSESSDSDSDDGGEGPAFTAAASTETPVEDSGAGVGDGSEEPEVLLVVPALALNEEDFAEQLHHDGALPLPEFVARVFGTSFVRNDKSLAQRGYDAACTMPEKVKEYMATRSQRPIEVSDEQLEPGAAMLGVLPKLVSNRIVGALNSSSLVNNDRSLGQRGFDSVASVASRAMHYLSSFLPSRDGIVPVPDKIEF